MNKSKNISPVDIYRTDKGGCHKSGLFESEDTVIRQYRLNGEFVAEYNSLRDALEGLKGNKTTAIMEPKYQGIYQCLKGLQKSYGGYLWRSNKGLGRGYLMEEDGDETAER